MDATQALSILKRFGATPDSFQTLADLERFTTDGIEGYIAVYRKRGLVIALSDPVCDPADRMRLVHALRLDARSKRQRIAFVAASMPVRDELELMDFGSMKTGDEGVFDLASYSFDTPERKEVRQSANKAEREGVGVRRATPSDRDDILALTKAWLATRKTEGFSLLLGLDPDLFADEKKVFVAHREGRLVGYLSCTPIYARNGWYFEDVIRSADAPRGTNHVLIREALRVLREEGYRMATLGAAPLGRIREGSTHGRRLVNRTLEFAYDHFNAFYNFKGLYDFKSSFAPSSWEPQFLCFYPRRLTPSVLIGVVDASLPGGVPKALAQKLRSVLVSVPKSASRSVLRAVKK